MNVKLDCPFAQYISGMKIKCNKIDGLCPHVYFKRCKGWWALSPYAANCPVKEDNNGKTDAAAPGR